MFIIILFVVKIQMTNPHFKLLSGRSNKVTAQKLGVSSEPRMSCHKDAFFPSTYPSKDSDLVIQQLPVLPSNPSGICNIRRSIPHKPPVNLLKPGAFITDDLQSTYKL